MADRPDITLDDLKTLARGQAPDLAQAIIHFAAQRVTGLTVNGAGPQVPAARVDRDVVRRLRAAIHNRKKGKPYREGESHASLQGMAAWIFMSDKKRGGAFLEQVAALPK